MYSIRKNSVITEGVYNGQTELGVDFFTGEELYTSNKIISTEVVCNRCGEPAKGKINCKVSAYICNKCKDIRRA